MARRLGVAVGEAERRVLGGLVSVHGNVCADGDRRVRSGDVLHVRGGPAAVERAAKRPSPQIVFQDADLLIADKPAGVTSVREPNEGRGPGRDPSPTFDELLQSHLGGDEFSRHKHGRGVRVRPVHRLDRDTSGLMAFALSPAAAGTLSGDFQTHRIERAYLAVVVGRLDDARSITTHLVRDRGDGRRGSLPPGVTAPGAQRAVTHVRPVEHLGDAYTLVECRLETGRTHQIRIHLSEAGHALCGDRLYGPRDQSGAPRQALHAYRLGLTHPTDDQPLRFESALAEGLEDLARETAVLHADSM